MDRGRENPRNISNNESGWKKTNRMWSQKQKEESGLRE